MKGYANMTRISSEQQLVLLADLFDEKIKELRSMPKEEAKVAAKRDLIEAGIFDYNGNFAEPYIALERNVQ